MTEAMRLSILSDFAETMGEEKAAALMESISPIPWHEFATKDDLKAFATKDDLADLRGWVETQFTMVAAEFVNVRGELAKAEGNLSKEIAEQSKEIAEQSKGIAGLNNKMANQTRVIVLTVVALISPMYLLLGSSAFF